MRGSSSGSGCTYVQSVLTAFVEVLAFQVAANGFCGFLAVPHRLHHGFLDRKIRRRPAKTPGNGRFERNRVCHQAAARRHFYSLILGKRKVGGPVQWLR